MSEICSFCRCWLAGAPRGSNNKLCFSCVAEQQHGNTIAVFHPPSTHE
jgi:hypothetical protein